MELKEAFDIVYKFARAASVPGDQGDLRDQALTVVKMAIDKSLDKKKDKATDG